MDNRLICPECNKPYKHLITHLQNKHNWEVEDIFNYNFKSKDATGGEREAACKVTEAELEVGSIVRRSVDKTVMMHALTDLNAAICEVYGRIEVSMKTIVMEAGKIYRRVGNDEIDGPRTDITRRVQEILHPSSQYLQECILHELCHISGRLKLNIIDQL